MSDGVLDFLGWLQGCERQHAEAIEGLRKGAEAASETGLHELAVSMAALAYSLERFDRELTRAAIRVIRQQGKFDDV